MACASRNSSCQCWADRLWREVSSGWAMIGRVPRRQWCCRTATGSGDSPVEPTSLVNRSPSRTSRTRSSASSTRTFLFPGACSPARYPRTSRRSSSALCHPAERRQPHLQLHRSGYDRRHVQDGARAGGRDVRAGGLREDRHGGGGGQEIGITYGVRCATCDVLLVTCNVQRATCARNVTCDDGAATD